MKVYLAGPRSGVADWNSPAFRAAAMLLRAHGFSVVSPLELPGAEEGMEGDVHPIPEDVYTRGLERCIAAMTREAVEAVVVLDGWENSRGASHEVSVARGLGKPILLYSADRLELGLDLRPVDAEATQAHRTFATGATRDTDDGKPDYEGYLSPAVLRAFGRYMLRHSEMPDGSRRASDNWQKGIPADAYVKSGFRHFVDWWEQHRAEHADPAALEEALCALIFNAQGYLHESLKADAPA